MSRVSLIEQLYVKKKSALEFNYDALWAPPILSILTKDDIAKLYKIATSLRYNGNIEKKYELIDAIMKPRGFRRAHCGTNRVVYNFLELPTFVAKIAIDKVGMRDSPAEYRNQKYFKPFCCKIFEVDPTGVIAFVERVNPITSLEEFLSISDDVFNMMLTKVIGKYVVDDLGTEKFMNYGLRYNSNGYTFGPVIIDFPYAYELDGAKLICKNEIKTPLGVTLCGGEIDYDDGLNHLICTKCGKSYSALDLEKENIFITYDDEINLRGEEVKMTSKARVIDGNGKVILQSGPSSKNYVSKEEYDRLSGTEFIDNIKPEVSVKIIRSKRKSRDDIINQHYTELQKEMFNRLQQQKLNDIINKKSMTIKNTIVNEDKTKIDNATVIESDKIANVITIDEKAIYQNDDSDINKTVSNIIVNDINDNAIVDSETDETQKSDQNIIETDTSVDIEEDDEIPVIEESDETDKSQESDQDVIENNTSVDIASEDDNMITPVEKSESDEEKSEEDNNHVDDESETTVNHSSKQNTDIINKDNMIYGTLEDIEQYNKYFGERERRKNRRNNNKNKKKYNNKNKGFYDSDDGFDEY